jgi:nitrogenase molybdenum-iron protein alpha/beta subunit
MTTIIERKRKRNAKYQARFRAMREAEGFKQFTVYMRPKAAPDVRRMVQRMAANPHLALRLVDARTGRRVAMK